MNTLKNLTKKAIAIGTGAVIVATTVAGAAALDLKDYPAPFVKDGQFNGLIVVGEKAATSDVLGSIEIASSLQAASTTVISNAGTSTSVTGDAKKIGSGGNMLETGEYIGDATQTLTEGDLAFLKGGSISTNSGDTDFVQTLRLDSATIGITNTETGKVLLKKDDNGNTGEFLYFANGQPLFQYTLEFTSGLQSSLDGTTATDMEDQSVFMLGQYFNVVRATASAGAPQTISLTLIAGDVTDTLKEGETKTYTVDGKSYEVTVLFVSDDGTAKFLINGQATKSLGKGDTDNTAGIDFGVRDVLSQSRGTTGGTLVEFYLGANKVEITDPNVANTGDGSIKVNGQTVDQATIDIAGTVTATTARVNKITYTLKTDAASGANLYLTKGQGIRDTLRNPDAMLAQKWDIQYQGVSAPATTPISIESSGDDQYDMSFTNVRGDMFRFPLIHAVGPTTWKTGDDTYNLIDWENKLNTNTTPDVAGDYPIGISDYFVVTGRTGASTPKDTDESYVLRFNSVSTSDKTVRFTMPGPGTEVTATYTLNSTGPLSASAPNKGTVTIGGKDYKFWLYNTIADGSGTWKLAVDLDGSGTLEQNRATQIVVKGGAVLGMNWTNTTANGVTTAAAANLNMTLFTAAKNVDSNINIEEDWGLSAANTQVATSVPVLNSGVNASAVYFATRSISGADQTIGVDQYGTTFTWDNPTNSPESLTIDYPAEQVEALVYVIGGDVQTSTVAGGQGVRVNAIKVGSAVLDSDVTADQANMIVVGGPCANTAAAALLGNPKDCTEGFTAGNGMIKLFDTGNNVAVLVAGYSAQDTQGASRVLAQYQDYKLSGTEADVTVTSLTQSGIMVKNQ